MIAAVIAEFNPLHAGHAYFLSEVRRRSGADRIVVVMSGNFVQRGEPALADKYTRAEMAIEAGADLVCELPAAASCGSAGIFAEGAVNLLDSLGVIDELWFGSESGETDALERCAEILAGEPEAYKKKLKELLGTGMPYPAAQEEAVAACFSEEESGRVRGYFRGANDLLGMTYISMLKRRDSRIVPRTILRKGAAHDSEILSGEFASASLLRDMIKNGRMDECSRFMPEASLSLTKKYLSGGRPLEADDFSDMLFYRIICEDEKSLLEYADISEALASRIMKYAGEAKTFEELAELVRSRNITHSRARRALLHILLQIRRGDEERLRRQTIVRILAMRKGCDLPGRFSRQGRLYPVMSPVRIPPDLYGCDLLAANLYEKMASKINGIPYLHEYHRGVIRKVISE